MARIQSILLFSDVLGINARQLEAMGVLDPTLNIDTPLFVDPFLLAGSSHQEMKAARVAYEGYFERIIALLLRSNGQQDFPWESARGLLVFPEVKGMCLGYGAASISGSGVGRGNQETLIGRAVQIVGLGVEDPDLFVSLALLEDGIGADRISDMTANVIVRELEAFNVRIARELGLPTEELQVTRKHIGRFIRNPLVRKPTPVVLIPLDVLRKLPIAADWGAAMDAASVNTALRHRVNEHIGDIWALRTRKDKSELRDRIYSSKEAFQALMDAVHQVPRDPYDAAGDPNGTLLWRTLAGRYAAELRGAPALPGPMSVQKAKNIVDLIIERFMHLIESRRFSDELYEGSGKPRSEGTAQKIFFAVADGYCRLNDIDITPEAETGAGPVDFKFSVGHGCRIVVEIKLSTNGKAVHGYEVQTVAYRQAEEAVHAVFVLIDVGSMGNKADRILEAQRRLSRNGGPVPEVVFIDGKPRRSASKL